MERAAGAETVETRKIERLRHDTLAGERCIPVHTDRQHGRFVTFAIAGQHLTCSRHSFENRIDDLEVTRIRDQHHLDFSAIRDLARACRAEVVLHVPGFADGVGRSVLALELLEDRCVWLAQGVREDVDAAAMRHREIDFARAVSRRRLDRHVEHRHQDVTALDRESLVTLIGATQKTLEAIYLREPLQNPPVFFFAEWLMKAPALDLLAQPFTLFDFAEVRDLESDLRRVELAQTRHHIGSAAARSTEGDAWNAGEVLLAQTMEFRGELGCSFGFRAQWIERDSEVSVAANGVDELSRSGNIAKKSGIDLSRYRRLTNNGSWRCSASYAFGKSEELAPRLINRGRIAPVRFVGLGYVSVVEDARDRVATHTSKFNGALPPSARR